MKGTVYDKARALKETVFRELDTLQDRDLFKIVAKLSTWHYPNKRTKTMKLSKQEAAVYEHLITNDYNPSTCYKWLLACSTNEDVQERLKQGTISLKKALSYSKPFNGLNQVEAEMLYQIKVAISKFVIR